MTTRSLLLVLAHPDDETFGPGGTVAKYSREGARIVLVTATSGQAGRSAGLASSPAELGRIREQEAREACAVLGISAVHFLGYQDGELNKADEQEVEAKVVHLIRQERPSVVITFGPEGAGNEHADHRQISRITTHAIASAADPEQFAAAPHLVKKFYYMTGYSNPWREMSQPFLPVTTAIDVSEYLETKIEAFRCHRSQQEWMSRLQEWIGANHNREVFHLAFSRAGAPPSPHGELETDLFAGIGGE